MMNRKRVLALLLAIVMVVGMFPMGAMAEETAATVPATTETAVETTGETTAPDAADGGEDRDGGILGKFVDGVKGLLGDTGSTEPAGTTGATEPTGTTGATETTGETEGEDPTGSTTAPTVTTEPTVTTGPQTEPTEGKTVCGICGGEHKAEECTVCLFCKAAPCTCVICEECGVKNDHTSTCSKKPCADCGKNPCECEAEETTEATEETTEETTEPVEVCEYCGVELTEDAEHEEDCLSLCTCEMVDGVHSAACVLYVEEEIEEVTIDIPELEESVFEVEFSGGLGLDVEVASPEVAYALQYAPATNARTKYPWRGVYDISAKEGKKITVTNLPTFTCEDIEIRHYLDSADAVSKAVSNGNALYLEVEGFEEYFTKEIAALQAVKPDMESTICYTMISSANGEVEIIGLEGGTMAVSFYADSYSYYEIAIAYESAQTYLNAAAPMEQKAEPVRRTFALRASNVDNPAVETSKMVIYDEQSGAYTLRLEGYATGSTIASEISTTKATDFVISIDISHSMPPCINCGASGIDSTGTGLHGAHSNCKVYAPDLSRSESYYLTTSETKKVKYCESCEGWFLEAHFAENAYGRHGSTSDVRYLPWENTSDKDETIKGVGDRQFFEEREGEMHPVYALDAGFSTNKVYYSEDNTVIKYCTICEKWVEGYHCTGGNVRTPGTHNFYELHECTEACPEDCTLKGTKVLVDTSSPDFSTEKEYYKDNNKNNNGNAYVIKYCSDCGRWFYNFQNHKHSTSEGDDVIPYEIAEYKNTQVDMFYTSCVSRMQAAKEAAAAFVELVYEKSKGADGIEETEDDVPHRVAVIGFGGDDTGDAKVGVSDYQTIYDRAKSKYTATGIYSLYNPDAGFGYSDVTGSYNNFESYHLIKDTKNYPDLAAKCYANALRDVTNKTEYAILKEGIKELNYNYGTYINFAAIMTEGIFEASYTDDVTDGINRNRVAVFFTDGQPDGDGEGVYDLANESIRPAYRMKNNENYKVSVYSIGIFAKADASKIWHLTKDNANQDEYMHMLSSNYPLAYTFESGRKMRDIGASKDRDFTINDVNSNLLTTDSEGNTIVDKTKGSYYLTADNAAGLVAAFETIAETNTSGGVNEGAKKLDAATILQDSVSVYFDIDSARDIHTWTETYTGDDDAGEKQWTKDTDSVDQFPYTKSADNVVRVTGFNYSTNYVGTTTGVDGTVTDYYGKKLVVEVPIKVAGTNMGGSYQPTNNSANSGIYYDGTMEEQFELPYVDVPRKITLSKELVGGGTAAFRYELSYNSFTGYTEESTSNYTSGNYLVAETDYLGDQNGIATVTVSPDDPATETVEGTVTIGNMMPGETIRITEFDVANYLVAVSLDGGITWKDQNGREWSEAVIEEETPLEYENISDEEIPVDPDDEQEDLNLEYVVTMDPETGHCTVEIPGDVYDYGMDIVFRNTLRVRDLIIKKDGIQAVDHHAEDTPYGEEQQSSRFHIKSEDGKVLDVVIVGNGSITIKDVPVGKYVVTELNGWSWRYFPDDTSKEITLTPDGENVVYFTNSRKNIYWLSGDNYLKNLFAGAAAEG